MAKVNTKKNTRLLKYLAAIAGDGEAPNPITELERHLYNIAQNVGAGSGESSEDVAKDIEDAIKELGLPTPKAADAGSTLGVDSEGKWVLIPAQPSGTA